MHYQQEKIPLNISQKRHGLSQQPKIVERQAKVTLTNGPQIVQKYIHLWLKKVKKHKEIYERNDKGARVIQRTFRQAITEKYEKLYNEEQMEWSDYSRQRAFSRWFYRQLPCIFRQEREERRLLEIKINRLLFIMNNSSNW